MIVRFRLDTLLRSYSANGGIDPYTERSRNVNRSIESNILLLFNRTGATK